MIEDLSVDKELEKAEKEEAKEQQKAAGDNKKP